MKTRTVMSKTYHARENAQTEMKITLPREPWLDTDTTREGDK